MSKILIKNIYYMLSYAYQELRQDKDFQKLGSEQFDNIYDLLSEILICGITHLIKKGIYKEYILTGNELQTVRGKISLVKTINNNCIVKHKLSCEYDEFSENVIHNQIIKTISFFLLNNKDLSKEKKKKLKRLFLYFSSIDMINLSQIHWNEIKFHKNNTIYRLILEICRFIHEGLLISSKNGTVKYKKFVDDQKMSHLYEKFILGYYAKHYPELHPSSSSVEWNIQIVKGEEFLPNMRSDISMYSKEKDKSLIIDAKFYNQTLATYYDKKSLHSGNLYQIFTYVKNKDVNHTGKVSGLLLYAKTEEELVPSCEFIMDGNRIGAQTLDLNKTWPEIDFQLKTIVSEWINDCAH